MAFITFFAKNKYVALCRLTRTMVLGRSLDCQIFVPDVFVSRHHCRIERTPAGWTIVDLGSTNGIYVDGMRVMRHRMQENDVVEIGTIAIEFHEGQPGEVASSTAPFGAATPVSELVDTVYAMGLRPVDFSRQALRRQLWAVKMTGEEAVDIDEAAQEPLPGRYPEEWVELDIEWQLADGTFHTTSALRTGWEWTDLDLCIDMTEGPAVLSASEPVHSEPQLLELEDDTADTAPEERVEEDVEVIGKPRGRMGDMISKAERQYDEDHKVTAKTWRAGGPSISLVEKAREALEDLRDSEWVYRLRNNPRPWIGIAAVLAMVIYAGTWTTRRLNRPPVTLSDGKPNPAYFNGDSHD